jgi:HD-like signal output (HDOD) protein
MKERKGIERKVAQLIQILPPMPENICRLMTARPDSNKVYKQVRALVDNDPGLCSDLLHLAGDICYGSGETIETIDDAVRHVGIEPLIQLIGISYAKQAIKKEFAMLKHLNDYFEHSRKISLCCQILAKLHGMPEHNRQMYAVAGLIHDIGRLVIMVAANKTTVRLMGTSWDKMLSVVHDEKEIMGMNHSDIGMQLCNKWHFSIILQEAVLRHHTPLIKNDFSFPGAMIFVSHFVSFSDLTGEILSAMLEPELLSYLQLTVVDFGKAHEMFQSISHSNGKKLTDM